MNLDYMGRIKGVREYATVSGTEIGTLTTAPLIPHCLSYPRDIMRMKGI